MVPTDTLLMRGSHPGRPEAEMPDTIIDVTGLVKTYDTGVVRVEALRGIDMAVERGLSPASGTRPTTRRRANSACHTGEVPGTRPMKKISGNTIAAASIPCK